MPHDQPIIAVEAADGHRFELIHVPAAAPAASLLFLPGMGLTARQYIALAHALAQHHIEVFIHEWRGLGSSSRRASRQSDWSYRDLLQTDLTAALEQARKRARHARLILGGHSLGSQFAALLGAAAPEHCAGVVVVAGGSPYWRCFSGWRALLLRAAFFGMPLVARLAGHYPGRRLGFAGREARGVISDWALTGRRGGYNLSSIDHDLEAALSTLSAPVLGVRLEDDWFVPSASLNHLLGKLGGEVELAVLSADQLAVPADHYAWMRAPAAVAETIAGWQQHQRTAASRRA